MQSPERRHNEFFSDAGPLHTIPTEASVAMNSVRPYKSSSSLRKPRSALGLHPSAPVDKDHDIHPRQQLLWSRIRTVLREPFAEFWGTFIMIMFGDGSVAQVLLSTGQNTAPGGNGFGPYQSISWDGAQVYCSESMSQATLALPQPRYHVFKLFVQTTSLEAVSDVFPGPGPRRVLCIRVCIYTNYLNAINNVEGHGIRTVPPSPKATAGIFCTYPQPFMIRAGQFFSELIASTLLMFVIFALKDLSNNGVPKSDKWFPLCLFFLIFGLGACFGWETRYAINLERDFGPRLMSYTVVYGHEVWTAGGYYFWVPMVAPFCGCAFGGFLYDVFIYTGHSLVNTPWLGLKHIFRPDYAWKVRQGHLRRNKEQGIV
ncbi:aquaporin-like protein [Lindgomyces ingoldianus]|uniref:Aquaporin-like protein n=1 Tax=Lindgomyces ingoldianus TaxID=673940 RepID=A0ACB6QF16_9PLEO|nr:aquaporin-like protein [Lindgomyces ingoldianus]KAF2465504.1 aquaporin-like protein [Lindgomyces ingoldianus]